MQVSAPDSQNDPRDQIWINLLCPAHGFKAVCTQKTCGEQGFRNGGTCTLNGQPWASFCQIPQSHPVKEIQRQIAADNLAARQAATKH